MSLFTSQKTILADASFQNNYVLIDRHEIGICDQANERDIFG